jgi:hypothetical protein
MGSRTGEYHAGLPLATATLTNMPTRSHQLGTGFRLGWQSFDDADSRRSEFSLVLDSIF